jgi:predicted TPR repeat methyltransferase
MSDAAAYWDAEFRRGRYSESAPIGFTAEILAAAHEAGIGSGLYVGCGNGRNYRALVDGGLDLVGLDISPVAIEQLAARMPERKDKLVTGDLSALPTGQTYPLVVAIQVLHHGTRSESESLFAATADRVAAGGMLAIGIETVGTDVAEDHEVLDRADDGSYTVRYLDHGSMTCYFRTVRGVHLELAAGGLEPHRSLVPRTTWRTPHERGQTLEWEGLYRRP